MHLLRANANLDATAKELAEEEIKRLSHITKQTLTPHRGRKLPVVTKPTIVDDVCSMFHPQLVPAGIELRSNYVPRRSHCPCQRAAPGIQQPDQQWNRRHRAKRPNRDHGRE
jgi:hypothetical protein